MFICNLKFNSKKIIKILIIFFIVSISILIIYSLYSMYKTAKKDVSDNEAEIIEINSIDFTNFLKNSHEKINEYIGKKIKISGYVYRMPDFNNNQFVLSRTMVLDSNNGVVVGILSEYDKANEFNDYDWVTVEGTIEKGNYNGEMPVLKINNISTSEQPENEYVYPPTNTNVT